MPGAALRRGCDRDGHKSGHLDSALTKLDLGEKAKGPTGESLDLRGSIALEQGKFDLALHAFTEAHKLEPDLFAPAREKIRRGTRRLSETLDGDEHPHFQ